MQNNLSELTTERRNPNTTEIDRLSTEEIIRLINDEDKKVAYAVEKEIPNIAKAVELISEKLYEGGRLIYLGAGTSGRLGILDASECPPTFGVPQEMVQGIIAGGHEAILKAVEGAEDSKENAVADLKRINFNNKDVLVGITASGRTPYVIGAIEYANKLGAITIGVTNNYNSEMSKITKVCIAVEVGPEVITGSTRMKAGTAQKMVLNMLSTGSMIKLGKVYENLMVDVESTNSKLKERCKNIVMELTSVGEDEAIKYLQLTDYNVKLSVFMIKTGLDKEKSEEILNAHRGYLRKALEAVNKI
ncbi:MAG: N-acetylmuramic acid 6-phosphate etherase [Tepidanaerobacter acetatoxydans]|uniref:N-acetylmuramic acid 6-phosphate etherase n=1 Tax=Tepidanaerobacter TaxID=499228 RepID=UPI000A9332BC|nr:MULTISPECIES: N-acetylmuramic acid 6-phosphate etherase [Tepidanaerobacter]NLU10245.1 N-acetylmuramic acid 6-phosphate etherase [Tepidanaerobacter acetatoxydans]